MKFTPTFEVHQTDPLYFVESPFIVTTAYTSPSGYPKGEWFLVIPEDGGKLLRQRTILDCTAFPEAPITFNEAFMLNEVLQQAINRLRTYILEAKGNDAHEYLSKKLEIHPSDPNLLINFWLRDAFVDCLSQIRRESECGPLLDFVDRVGTLPKFRFNKQ